MVQRRNAEFSGIRFSGGIHMNSSEFKRLTTPEKWRLVGHLLFSAGTLCLSISSLLRLAQEGDLPDVAPTLTKSPSSVGGREQGYDFFRRS